MPKGGPDARKTCIYEPADLRALVPGATLGGPGETLAGAVGRAGRLFGSALHPLLAALAAIGLVRLWPRPGARRVLLVLAAFLGLAVLLDWRAGYLHRRHLAMAAVLGTLFAGAGAVAIAERLRPRWAPAVLAVAIAAVLLPKALAPQFEHREGFRAAGAWLRAHGGEGALVLGLFGTEIAYYGGAREMPMPPGSADDVLAAARAAGARFLAISLRARGERDLDTRIEGALAAAGLAAGFRHDETIDGRRYRRLIYTLR